MLLGALDLGGGGGGVSLCSFTIGLLADSGLPNWRNNISLLF
jgi:hypothetical protein